jgi:hypothetical protein
MYVREQQLEFLAQYSTARPSLVVRAIAELPNNIQVAHSFIVIDSEG